MDQARRFIEDAWPHSPLEEPRVKYWRAVARAVLLALLALSGLQYYFLHVHLTILALPSVALVAGLP